MRRHGRTKVIVTDRLRSYGAATKEIGGADLQQTGRRLNNRADDSHLPFRRRERAMQRFRRMKTLQKFASVHASVYNHFSQGLCQTKCTNSQTSPAVKGSTPS